MRSSRHRNPTGQTGINQKQNSRSQFVRGGMFSASMATGGAASKILDELFLEDPKHSDPSVEEADEVFSIFDLLG